VPHIDQQQFAHQQSHKSKNKGKNKGKKKGCQTEQKCRPTIGDRQFVSFVQFYLHKCGKFTIGMLEIVPLTKWNGSAVVVKVTKSNQEQQQEWPLADGPMPTNVKNFRQLTLKFAFLYNKLLQTK
jgi:hypothetical protein